MTEDLLQGWQDWPLGLTQQPDLLGRLEGGSTNQSYLIKAGDTQMVLRVNASNSDALGINRQHEKIILEKVSALGLCPEVFYVDVDAGICLSQYVGENYWQNIAVQQFSKRQRLLAALNQIHRVECELPPRRYRSYLNHYWHGVLDLDIKLADEIYREREFLLTVIDEFSSQPAVLTHHDLVTSNIIDCKNQLYVLDWEYAAMGQAEFDVASLIREWSLSVQDLSSLDFDRDKLDIALRLYDHIYQLWYFLQD
ncbi:MAG: thiamine kinase [Pseudomonadales bacterium]